MTSWRNELPIENWDPDYQAKLRELGLRSSFELDDEEGSVFVALSADRYPIGVMGRRNTVGDLFVSRIIAFPQPDFTTAIDKIKQRGGVELIVGVEARELLCKMEQAKGIAPRTAKSKEIWEVENWGDDEWVEQTMAEIAFAKAMNVQYVPDPKNLNGNVAGYRVRRAPNGLVLVGQRQGYLCGSAGGENARCRVPAGLVARIGREDSTVLSEELLGHSPRGLARYGRAPRQGTARDNATVAIAAATKGTPVRSSKHVRSRHRTAGLILGGIKDISAVAERERPASETHSVNAAHARPINANDFIPAPVLRRKLGVSAATLRCWRHNKQNPFPRPNRLIGASRHLRLPRWGRTERRLLFQTTSKERGL